MRAVFLKDLLIALRDRAAVFIALVVPVFVISILGGALQRNRNPLMRLPVVNEDQGPVAGTFITLLRDHARVEEVDRAQAEYLVRDRNRVAAAIVFPEGLSRAYLQGRTADILLLTDPARAGEVGRVKVLLLLMDKRAAALADPLAEERLSLKELALTGKRADPGSLEQTVPGYSLMFVLLAVIFGTAGAMHDERGWGTLPRLLVAPAGFTWMLLGKLGVRYLVGIVQMLVLLVFGHFTFGVSLGPSPLALVLLVTATVFPVVGLGMLTAGLAGTREQTLPLGLAFVLAFSCLGGLWWPPWVTPEWMQNISSVVFTTWAMQGMQDLMLRDRGLEALPVTAGVLTLYGVVFTAAGLALFRARHSAR